MSTRYRKERDSLGEYLVPKDAYYGVQTMRSLMNFKITNQTIHPILIKSLGMVKKACVMANNRLGHIDDERTKYIKAACDEVIKGELDKEFPTDPIQGGAGTSINMNANEVIANRANELAGYPLGTYEYVHPNDHINFSQSTNDVFPTAGKITSLYLVDFLISEMEDLKQTLLRKSEEFKGIIKVGRTHLQDAIPIQLSQEFHAYYSALNRDIQRIKDSFLALHSVNMGATAIGTGLNADEGFRELVIPILSNIVGIDVISSEDLVDGTRHVDPFVWAHSSLNTFCVNLSKMCNDFRLMASGPVAGLNEIRLPERQPGSSIMPGKVNPVILEVCNQVCFQVFGNQVTITKAAEAGQLELNVMEPVLLFNLFQSLEILTNACHTLNYNCIAGIEANASYMRHQVDISLSAVTALAPSLGYKVSSDLAKEALTQNKMLKQLILEKELLTDVELAELLEVENITTPGIPGLKKKRKKEQ